MIGTGVPRARSVLPPSKRIAAVSTTVRIHALGESRSGTRQCCRAGLPRTRCDTLQVAVISFVPETSGTAAVKRWPTSTPLTVPTGDVTAISSHEPSSTLPEISAMNVQASPPMVSNTIVGAADKADEQRRETRMSAVRKNMPVNVTSHARCS